MANQYDLYPSVSDPREISVRDEFSATIQGSSTEIAKGQAGLLRRIRRDGNNKLIPCECKDPITREGDKDHLCLICLGEGHKWDEIHTTLYKVVTPKEVAFPAGLTKAPSMVFYLEHDVVVSDDDKIIELVLDAEGAPVLPYKRKAVYEIIRVGELRLDNGRLEYLKLWTFQQDVKFL